MPAYREDSLEILREVFEPHPVCALGQAWRPVPEKDWAPGWVRMGWRDGSLRLLAQLEDADIHSEALAHNQRMWELGDVLEIFLQPVPRPDYVELHVTPHNQRLQLRFPGVEAVRQAQAADDFNRWLLPDGVFFSRTWIQAAHGRWWVYARIPAAAVCGAPQPLPDTRWRFCFGRYDYTRGRPKPVLSSSSALDQPKFHLPELWGTLEFVTGPVV